MVGSKTAGKKKLECKMGFQYCQAVGEVLFAHITTKLDTQYNDYAASPHYTAVKNLF